MLYSFWPFVCVLGVSELKHPQVGRPGVKIQVQGLRRGFLSARLPSTRYRIAAAAQTLLLLNVETMPQFFRR